MNTNNLGLKFILQSHTQEIIPKFTQKNDFLKLYFECHIQKVTRVSVKISNSWVQIFFIQRETLNTRIYLIEIF